MLSELLALTVLIAGCSASLLICMLKWGIMQYWDVRRPWWLLAGYPRCEFCLSFWFGLLLFVLACLKLGLPWWCVVGAFPAAGFSRAVYGVASGE